MDGRSSFLQLPNKTGRVRIVGVLIALSAALSVAELVNTSVIPVGETRTFKAAVSANVDASHITWHVLGGKVSFEGGQNTGPSVRVRGDAAGRFKIEMRIEHLALPPGMEFPNFEGEVAAPATIPVRLCIVHEEGTGRAAITEQAFDAWLASANSVYEQVALRFVRTGETLRITNNMYFTIPEEDLLYRSTISNLTSTLSGTGGLEIYCVNNFEDPTIGGVEISRGLTISATQASARTLAHELGHACGLLDVYECLGGNGHYFGYLSSPVKQEWMPNDWGGGYYPPNFQHAQLLGRLLMLGWGGSQFANSLTIPRGRIYGYNNVNDTGMIKVGAFDLNRSPSHE